jgi:hypothetical protein
MIRLNDPVSMKCKTDKPDRHKDGSGHHHPMGVFPIEQQVEHFGRQPATLELDDLLPQFPIEWDRQLGSLTEG